MSQQRLPLRDSYEGLYNRARDMGVIVVKGRPSEIEEVPNTKSLVVMAEDLYTGERLETTTDLVVLATALHPHDDTADRADDKTPAKEGRDGGIDLV